MKHLIALLFLFSSTTALAEISCVVPYGSPNIFNPVQKLLIDYQENRYFVRWPVESECVGVEEEVISCTVVANNREYEAIFNVVVAAGSEYQEAGMLSVDRFLFWNSESPIYCKTVE